MSVLAGVAAAAAPASNNGQAGFAVQLSEKLTSSLAAGDYALVLVLALVGGVLLALTPCVLPIVPIVVSVLVGGKSARPARRALSAAVYTLGLALVYATLGLTAALTDGLIGGLLQNNLVLAAFSAFFVLLALSMFGVYDLEMPAGLRDKLQMQSKGDLAGALLMGLVSGLIASPCIGPVILGVLLWIANTRNAALGFSVLFTMGWGLGLPFIIAAIAGGRFLRPGAWMDRIKKLLGMLLLVGAAYFAHLATGNWTGLFALAALCVVVAALGLALYLTAEENSLRRIRTTGIWQTGLWGIVLALVFGMALVKPERANSVAGNVPAKEAPCIRWDYDVDGALARAQAEGKPAMIDFSAEWCIPCREMDATTFVDPAVVKEAQRFVAIKADLTKRGDPEVRKLHKRFRIFAPPVVIFVDSSGKILEAQDQRVVGLIGPREFLRRMKQVR